VISSALLVFRVVRSPLLLTVQCWPVGLMQEIDNESKMIFLLQQRESLSLSQFYPSGYVKRNVS